MMQSCDTNPIVVGADVLITDNNHDLNVYSDTRKDGTNNPCCGPETDNSNREVIPSSCGGNTREMDCSKTSSSRPKAINFNEWAGTHFSRPSRGLPVLVSADDANRVL